MCQVCENNSIVLSMQDYEKIKDFAKQLNCKVSFNTPENIDPKNIDQKNINQEIVDLRPIKRQTFDEIIKEYGMTDEQVEFYKKYSMERSRRAYEIVALKELGNSGLIDDWVYYGYYDSGCRGNEFCEAGHPLRYVHIAHNKKTGKELKFGIKCVTDFFNLSSVQLKFIKNGFNEANAEIQQGIDKFVKYNGNFDEYENQFHYQAKLDFITENTPHLLKLDNDDLVNMLKLAELRYMFNLKLFLPDSFERIINVTYWQAKKQVEKETHQHSSPLLQDKKDIIDYIKQQHSDIYKIILSLTKSATPSNKQKFFLDKLLNTPWQQVDEIIAGVKNEKITIKKGYLNQIYYDIIDCYHKYGITEKQFNLLKKTIIYKK